MDWYNYGARNDKPVLSRFTTMDPLTEKYYSISPYAGYNYDKSVKDGIFIHSTNFTGYAGRTLSTGCLLLSSQDFKAFNKSMSGVKNFTVQVVRQQIVIVPLQ